MRRTGTWPSRRRVVVVGGGISGLAAAWKLAGSLPAGVDLRLFEASPRTGGQIRTETAGPLRVEAGPDSLLGNKPEGIELCRRLGLARELTFLPQGRGGIEIAWNGRLHALPEGFLLLAPTRVWPLLRSSLFTARGKARILAERWIPRRARRGDEEEDESLAGFVRRRFGAELLERVAQPVIGGLYTADAEGLSLATVMPRFLEMERRHGSVTRALLRARRREGGRAVPRAQGHFAALRDGMERLPQALAEALPPGTVRTGVRLKALRPAPGGAGFVVELEGADTLRADAVVLALPGWAAAPPLAELDPDLAGAAASLDYAPCATVSLAYRRERVTRAPRGYGFFAASREPSDLLACSDMSRKFPDRAPDDILHLRAFLGGAGSRVIAELDDAALADAAHRALSRYLGLPEPPVFARVFRYERAMPQYPVGYPARRRRLEELCARHPGLHLAGSLLGAVGIPDCIRSGLAAADAVVAGVGESVGARRSASQV